MLHREIDRHGRVCKATRACHTSQGKHAVSEGRKRKPDLEKSLGELEAIVEQLEEGDLSLDQSLKQFEKGVRISRECQAALKDAEQKVQVLVGDDLKDLDADELEED